MSTEFDAASALVLLSGGASNEEQSQIVRLGKSVLKLNWMQMTFEELQPEVLVPLQPEVLVRQPIRQSDERIEEEATSSQVVQQAGKSKRPRQKPGRHELPSLDTYRVQFRKPLTTLSKNEKVKISDAEISEMSSVTPFYYACPCRGPNAACPNKVMLVCQFCPLTKLKDGKAITNFGQNPIACPERDVRRNWKAHVDATSRMNHTFWNAVALLWKARVSNQKAVNHDTLLQILQKKQYHFKKMERAFRNANLIDSDEARKWGNHKLFSRAKTLFEDFGIDINAKQPRKRSKQDSEESQDEQGRNAKKARKRSRQDSEESQDEEEEFQDEEDESQDEKDESQDEELVEP